MFPHERCVVAGQCRPCFEQHFFHEHLGAVQTCVVCASDVEHRGDVLGTIQSSLVLGDARGAHLREFFSSPLEDKGVCDEWFVDDGQVFGRLLSF